MTDLASEAAAFNRQIRERVSHGHIPDLRRVEPCDYFYNNPWRRPEYVRLDFGHLFDRIDAAIKTHAPSAAPKKVLEVGCGPGYLSLELARAGHDVTGIDIADEAVSIARDFADADPWAAERGPLRYLVCSLGDADELAHENFDAVVFLGALHHMPDQQAVGHRVNQLLAPGGIIVAHEPTRDRIDEGSIEFGFLVRLLLAVGGGYHEDIQIPETPEQKRAELDRLKRDIEFVDEGGGNTQSPNDNEAGHKEMHAMLSDVFETVVDEDTFAFFHEVIGGLRFDDRTNAKLAEYLRDADAALVEKGVLQAYEFFFVGRKKR